MSAGHVVMQALPQSNKHRNYLHNTEAWLCVPDTGTVLLNWHNKLVSPCKAQSWSQESKKANTH